MKTRERDAGTNHCLSLLTSSISAEKQNSKSPFLSLRKTTSFRKASAKSVPTPNQKSRHTFARIHIPLTRERGLGHSEEKDFVFPEHS